VVNFVQSQTAYNVEEIQAKLQEKGITRSLESLNRSIAKVQTFFHAS
jgi:hypothetical protein